MPATFAVGAAFAVSDIRSCACELHDGERRPKRARRFRAASRQAVAPLLAVIAAALRFKSSGPDGYISAIFP